MGDLHPPQTEFVVTTDDDGYFTAELPPGYWGIEIPDMAGYSGSEYRACALWEGDLRVILRTDYDPWEYEPEWIPPIRCQRGYWPVAEPWDVEDQVLAFTHERPTVLTTWSGADIEFESLYVSPSIIEVGVPYSRGTSWPTTADPLPSSVSLSGRNHIFFLLEPELTVDGPYTEVVKDLPYHDPVVRFEGGGVRDISISHSLYECDTRTFDFAMQEYPGKVPEEQFSAPYVPAGQSIASHDSGRISDDSRINCIYPALQEHSYDNIPTFNVYRWCEDELFHCPDEDKYVSGGNIGLFTIHDALPNFRWSGVDVAGLSDGQTGTVWITGSWETDEGPQRGWKTVTITGGEHFELFIGGPDNSFDPSLSPPSTEELAVTIRTFLPNDGEIEGIVLSTLGPDPFEVTTPATVGSSGFAQLYPTAGEWSTGSRLNRLENVNPPKIESRIHVERNQGVAGTVVDESAAAVEGVDIRVRDSSGRRVLRMPLSHEAVSDESGEWSTWFGTNYSTVFLEAEKRGFLPHRERVDLDDFEGEEVFETDFVLKRPPPPVMESSSIDRAGLFLPGVRKTGAPGAFGPTEAIDALTATWTVDAPPQESTVTLAPYPHHDGESETVTMQDPVIEAWLVDRRRFPSGFFATEDGDIEEVSIPDELDIRQIRQFLEGIPGDEVIQSQGEQVEKGVFEGELELWKLPPGELDPVVVLISQLGAVGIFDFEFDGPDHYLEGADMPEWSSHFLTVLGTAAHMEDQFADFLPEDSLVPGTDLEGSIARSDADDRYLVYDYSLGATKNRKNMTPTSGLIAMGAESMGLSSELSINFGVDGKDREVSLGGSGELGVEAARNMQKGMPAIGRRIPVAPSLTVSPSVSASIEIMEHLGSPEETIPDLSLERTISGDLEAKATFPFGRAVALLGPLGAIVSSAGSILFDLDLVMTTMVGGTLTDTMRTAPPRLEAGGTVVDGDEHPPRRNFLGVTNEESMEFQLRFGASGGVSAKTKRGALSGVGRLQLDSPADSDASGVTLDFNTSDRWPLITQATGAVSFHLTLSVKLLGVSASRSWQYDFLDFDLQFNTDPFVDLPEGTVETFVQTPMTAPASEFVDRDQIVVENFYTAGAFDAVATEDGGLAYTATDPRHGRIEIVFSHRGDGGELEYPELITEVDGVVDIAAASISDGLLVVWSEVGGDDLGDPLGDTTLRYSTFGAGGWSEPQTLAAIDGAASGLEAVSTDSGAMLVWQRAIGHALSPRSTIEAAHYGAGTFSEPFEVYGPATIVDAELATMTDDAAVAIAKPEEVLVVHFDETGPGSSQIVADLLNAAVAWDDAGDQVALWVLADTALHRFDESDDFSSAEVVVDEVFGRSLLAAGDQFVAWTANDETDAMWYVVLDGQGQIDGDPVRMDSGLGTGFFDAVLASDEASGAGEFDVLARRTLGATDQIVAFGLRTDGEPAAPAPTDLAGWDFDGSTDTDTDTDTGTDDGEEVDDDERDDDESSGCGCTSTFPAPGSLLLLVLIALALFVIRHRGRASGESRHRCEMRS